MHDLQNLDRKTLLPICDSFSSLLLTFSVYILLSSIDYAYYYHSKFLTFAIFTVVGSIPVAIYELINHSNYGAATWLLFLTSTEVVVVKALLKTRKQAKQDSLIEFNKKLLEQRKAFDIEKERLLEEISRYYCRTYGITRQTDSDVDAD